MKLKIDFANPILDRETAEALTLADLDNFYANENEINRLNLFFVLEASFHYHRNLQNNPLAAHLAFLTAYYLFTPLTPPASLELALHYIKEAIRLDPLPEYQEWQLLIQQGN